MSTTLTNGLKLPDKGSVDWYADMQSNYAILDGAVGTVAEHTTALAGKAPAVHTHTVSQITDFPAYGTTAGTICEGNDSRLSDARTPVAHTHGNVTNDGKLATASKVVISDSNKNITTSSVSDTELGYLSGVTSSVQTQLNGKAASNHVHGNISNDGKVGTTANKPLITGGGGRVMTGAFGNAANTFCEGNDSRLSDARTPVAHTHLTSDVTDLLNGDHTWTGDNTYSKTITVERNTDTGNFLALKNSVAELGSTPASATPVTIAYRDKNNNNLGYMGVYYDTDGSNLFRIFVRNKYTSGAPSPSGTADYVYFGLKINADKSKEGVLRGTFRPYDNNTYDLGSSSYQWNNLYAKNYYYNGTPWGLDKENVWSGSNRFTKSINLGSITSYTDCTLGFTGLYNNLFFNTRGSSNITSYGTYVYYGYSNASSDRGGVIRMVRTTDKRGDTNDGYIPDLSFNLYKISPAKLFIDFMEAVKVINDGSENSLKPITTGVTDLGTSTARWKTLNGINPGALSLPDISDADPIYTNNWVGDNSSSNQYTPTENGWIYFRVEGANKNITIRYGGAGGDAPSITSESTLSHVSVFFPVRSGVTMYIFFNGTMVKAFFYPCLGNV